MVINIGDRLSTADGAGVVVAKERFGNSHDDYRVGVKHDVYPEKRLKGYYKDDVLYYFLREVTAI